MIANLHADITLSPKSGKIIPNIKKVTETLKNNPEIDHYSKTIEEKVLLNYGEASEITYLRGVDSAYVSVNPINENIFYGAYPSFKYSNEVILENQLDNRLSIPVGGSAEPAMLYMPKPGKGIIQSEENIFNKKEIFVTGVFPGNDQLNNYIISPLELAQELLNLPRDAAYDIVIKLKNPLQSEVIRDQLASTLGPQFVLKTKSEENAAFWKMINTEKMMIYLIFALVIFITTFNLAGAIIILQLDKKEQSQSLISLGFPISHLRQTYFYTGFLIVLFGIICGLLLGTLICYFQINTGFFKASESLPFPVKIELKNYAIVTLVASFFGLTISWFFSKINNATLKS